MESSTPEVEVTPLTEPAPRQPTGAALMEIADGVFELVQGIKIDSQLMYDYAAAELVDLSTKRSELEEKRFAITRPMDASKRATMALFKPALDRMDKGISNLKGGMLAFAQAEKVRLKAAQKLLDNAAQVERERVIVVQQQQSTLAREQSDLAASLIEAGATEGVSEALDAAESAQAMAATLASTSMVIAAPQLVSATRKVAGVSVGGAWKARIVDPVALVKYLAERPEYIDWIEFKLAPLTSMAKAQRSAMQIPGVEAFEDSNISLRRT